MYLCIFQYYYYNYYYYSSVGHRQRQPSCKKFLLPVDTAENKSVKEKPKENVCVFVTRKYSISSINKLRAWRYDMPPPAVGNAECCGPVAAAQLQPIPYACSAQRDLLPIAVGTMNINDLMNINDVRESATIFRRHYKLTFDLLTLKVVSESRVTWAASVPILVFLGLCSRVISDVCDRQTSDVSQTSNKSIA